MAAQRFVDLWQSGTSDEVAHDTLASILSSCELTGRMIHGLPDDPGFGKLLSSDEWKRLSWVFGPDALACFLGQSPRRICLHLGFGEEWLDRKLKQGKLFKLCVFPSASISAVNATWDNVAALLEAHYPEVWPKIARHYARIRNSPLEELQAEGGYDMMAANLAGRDHATGESSSDEYMSLQRLTRIDEPSAAQVRQFLWDEIGLKKLFRGDGYTYDDDGRRGSSEYLARQMPLDSIPDAVIVDVEPSRASGEVSAPEGEV